MKLVDAPLVRQESGTPSFSLSNRIHRVLWNATWILCAAWTPAGFSPWRVLLLRAFGARIAPGAAVAASIKVWLPRNLTLGARATIGPRVECYNMAPLSIGDDTVISQGAVLCGGTHDIGDPAFQLIAKPIIIGSHVWIASEAFVGPGVRVANGCVLGARACAFSDLEAWTVYRGNPAIPLKARRWRRAARPPATEGYEPRPTALLPPPGERIMRITCVLGPFFPVPPLRGGAVERIWLSLCTEFAARGHAVTLVSRTFADLPRDEVRDGVRFLRVPSADAPRRKLAYRLLDVIYALRVCRALPKADITITNSLSLPLLLPRSRAGRIYMSVARFPKNQMGLYRRVDRLQAVSRHVAEAIIAQSPAVAPLVRTIPNAISPTFAKARLSGRAPRGREVVFVGRLAREKGIDLLIRAFALRHHQYPDWTLTIVGPHETGGGGDGPAFLAELQALARPAGSRVTFAGPIFDEGELARCLLGAELFVYPSVPGKGEALPLAPVEAMACGCAVVVSSLECFRDYLVEGENGLVFDERDATGHALAATLDRLFGDAALRARLGRAAMETARRYTREMVANTFIADFESLLAQPSPTDAPATAAVRAE